MSLISGCQTSFERCIKNTAPIITNRLKRADPTIVPTPIAPWSPDLSNANRTTANSGVLEPAAINVDPAISEDILNLLEIDSRELMK